VDPAVEDPSSQQEAVAWDVGLFDRKHLLSKRSAQGPPPPEESGTANAPITWVFEPESFAPLAKLTATERFGIVTDHLGTPSAMLDELGATAWSADIGVYGDLRNVVGEKQACPFRWPGQYEDEETGLYYNRFRYYDPDAGEYVSQDPIGLRAGLQFASYARDPLALVDPLGLSCVPPDPEVADAIASGRPIVVVGRSMGRVGPVADAIRAAGGDVKTYNPRNFRTTPGNIEPKDVAANRSWLKYWAKDRNALIVDIGYDPAKPGVAGPFYGVERASLYKNWASDGVDVVPFNPGF
jgi:RHS repeat-associated protein